MLVHVFFYVQSSRGLTHACLSVMCSLENVGDSTKWTKGIDIVKSFVQCVCLSMSVWQVQKHFFGSLTTLNATD